MKKLKQLLASAALVIGVGVFTFVPSVGAVNVDPLANTCAGVAAGTSAVCDSADDDVSDVVATVVNVLLFIIGIISVIVIIVGGIMYTVSAGDSGQVTKAKNTILYAVVGLAVAFFAYAIVNWVVLRFI